MAKPDCRGAVLTAAEDVALEHGAAHLTLDAVALRAGVSKGGLLYHFPTKEALMTAMIERFADQMEAARAAAAGPAAGHACSVLRAHMGVCLNLDERTKRLSAALMAAVANCPRILDPMRGRILERLRFMSGHSKEPARAAILFLAAEGMSKLDMLGLDPFTPEERTAILGEMMRQAEELG